MEYTIMQTKRLVHGLEKDDKSKDKEIIMEMVNYLYDKTYAGKMNCKKALFECDMDAEKALQLIRSTNFLTHPCI